MKATKEILVWLIFKKQTQMKAQFKVGDRVRLKKNLKVNVVYGGLTLLPDMIFNGEKVITSTSTGLLIVWTSNKENSIVKDLIEIKVSEYSILNMRICETSKKIYCTDSNRKLFIINMENNAIENNIVLSDNVKGIDINLRGKLLLGLANGNIFIKNLKSGRQRDISYSHSYGKLRGLDYTLPNFVN